MLNIRFVAGTKTYSNHSWGAAIDIKINNQLDSISDGKTQLGLLELYPYFREAGWYWGAVFNRGKMKDDSMHFEASKELLDDWKKQGLLS
jgi:D-alanyl-D-alanine carboxypeptidase